MRTKAGLLLCAVAAVSLSTAALGSDRGEKTDIGKREFQNNCASCHGVGGKGDGPTAGYLTKHAADLTVLTRNNKGVFPIAKVYEVIDGTKEVAGHGTRDMPVWGMEYQKRAAEYYRDVDYDPEIYVRARILALIDYINRLQAK
jgi:mono/diheme cytochrome c family protein